MLGTITRALTIGLALFLGWTSLADAEDLDLLSPRRVAISPDGKQVAMACSARGVLIFDAREGKLLHEIPQEGNAEGVLFHPTKPIIYWGDFVDRTDVKDPVASILCCGELREGKYQEKWAARVNGRCNSFAFAKEANSLITIGSYGNTVFVDPDSGKFVRIWQEKGNGIRDVVISDDEKQVVLAGQALGIYRLRFNDLTGEKANFQTEEAYRKLVDDKYLIRQQGGADLVVYRPGTKEVIAKGIYGSDGGRSVDLCRFHLETGELVGWISKTQQDATCLVCFHDGNRLAVGHDSGVVEIWDISEAKRLKSFSVPAMGPIRSIALLPNEQAMAVGDEFGRTLAVVKVDDGAVKWIVKP